jgi:hypothetical protein
MHFHLFLGFGLIASPLHSMGVHRLPTVEFGAWEVCVVMRHPKIIDRFVWYTLKQPGWKNVV